MLESLHFSYNGISSKDKGVVIINSSGGLYEDYFLPSREIIEEKTPYNSTPYYMGTELEPLSFPITLWIKDWKDRNNLNEIAQWLFQPNYCPMTFESNPEQIYYVIFEGESKRIHNGLKDGYLELNIRCNSPFSYSYTRTEQLSVISSQEKILNINNDGDVQIYPRMKIIKTGSNGDIIIEHKQLNKQIVFTGIAKNEILEIDFKTRDITSSLESQNIYRYDNHNDEWLELIVGENELIFKGDFNVTIEYELMYITENYLFYF